MLHLKIIIKKTSKLFRIKTYNVLIWIKKQQQQMFFIYILKLTNWKTSLNVKRKNIVKKLVNNS